MSYKIVATDGDAKSATFETVHGSVETPVFMNSSSYKGWCFYG